MDKNILLQLCVDAHTVYCRNFWTCVCVCCDKADICILCLCVGVCVRVCFLLRTEVDLAVYVILLLFPALFVSLPL